MFFFVHAQAAFDPNSAGGTVGAAARGFTRLQFTSASDRAELPVADLNTPVLFTMPTTPFDANGGADADAGGDGAAAACQFWDPGTNKYRCV